MATFNTAFGSLPSPKTQLFGNYAGGSSPRASGGTGQIEQDEEPGTTGGMTFAQLQQQGRARPAPSDMFQAEAAPQQAPMLAALSAQLGQPETATPSTMFQPSLAPQSEAVGSSGSGMGMGGGAGAGTPREAYTGPLMAPTPSTGIRDTPGLPSGLNPEALRALLQGQLPVGTSTTSQDVTPMLSILGSRLKSAEDMEEEQRQGGPITTGGTGGDTGGAGGGAPGGGTPPTPTPAAPPMGYSPTGGITGTPTIDKTTDTATYTNVEVPVANAPRYTPGQVPPPTAPNGSTFVANTGTTWTKRGGVWVVEGQNVRGYAALTPPELLAQSQANLPEGASAGTFTMGGQQEGLDQFLRQYGTPSTAAEYAALAAQTGITVDALKSYIASAKGNLRFDTKQDVETRAEEQAWKATNNVGNLPYNYTYVPASQGGPGIRKLSFEEVTARGYQPFGGRALYNNPANDVALARQQGYVNLLNTFELGRTEKIGTPQGPAPTTPPRLTALTTPTTTISFAPNDPNGPWTTDQDNWVEIEPGTWQPRGPEANRWSFINGRWTLKDQGDSTNGGSNQPPPRTTPPVIPMQTPPETGGGGPPSRGGTPPAIPRTTIPTLPPFDTAPTGPRGALPSYGALTDTAKDLRTKLMAQLDLLTGPSQIQGQAYEALRKAKADELAAQYGAERSKLEEELARRGLSASTIGGGRYGDLAGQQARAVAGFEAELLQQQAEADARRQQMMLTGMSDLTKIETDIALRAAQLQQEASLRGRELDLTAARDMATAEYQRGQLGLGYAEIGSRERMQTQQQEFTAAESAKERYLRDQMQIRELTSQEKRDLADLTFRREQLAEQKRAAGVSETLQQQRFEEEKRAALVLEKIRQGELTLSQGTQVMRLVSEMWAGNILPEAFDIILRTLGLNPADYAGLKPPAKKEEEKKDNTPPNTPPAGPTGPGGNTPISISTIPNDLSGYPNGQRFNYFGVMLTLQNGVLRDDSGRIYRTNE